MKKNPHGKILKWEPKEQDLSIVLKFCSVNKHLQVTSFKLLDGRRVMKQILI